ncbi:MAG: hypothetical protein GEV03_26170 [Streptosporangiales bacterium]|nr:hypothetical protein [Streptosporangiales bacterium]
MQDPPPDSYARLRQLPTDPDELLSHLYRHAPGDRPRSERAWMYVTETLGVYPVPPEVQAAMFGAAAKIPGVTLVRDSVDAAGRHGVAVALEVDGVQEQLIFDPETFRYLGQRGVVADAEEIGAPKGSLVRSIAILETKVVDQPPAPSPGTEGWPCAGE